LATNQAGPDVAEVAAAWAAFVNFAFGKATSGEWPPLDAAFVTAFISLLEPLYADLPPDTRQLLAQMPNKWTRLQDAWPQMSPEERANRISGWREAFVASVLEHEFGHLRLKGRPAEPLHGVTTQPRLPPGARVSGSPPTARAAGREGVPTAPPRQVPPNDSSGTTTGSRQPSDEAERQEQSARLQARLDAISHMTKTGMISRI
jgi:hypothetical protein